MKKVYFMLADGFEEAEFVTPWDLLIRAGADVTVFSVSDREEVIGAHGLKVKSDNRLSDCKPDCDMIVLPGGGKGTENLAASDKVADLVRQIYADGGFVCAICAAPTVLAGLGLLDGVEAICFPGMENQMKNANLSQKNVVRDGNIITAAAMGVAADFGFELIRALFGASAAEAVADKTVSRLS